jgi:hypothetical protein
MNHVIKICLFSFVLWIATFQSVLAEVKMQDQQAQLAKKLKTQGIIPNKAYFQRDFDIFIDNKYSFPEEDLSTSVIGLENHPDMYEIAIQSIAQVKLNQNYQYSDIWQRKRNIIEILYPTDAFQSLEDGVYFYTLDEHKQLQQHTSFEDVFELPCYLRVEKKHGIVISIQKRPLTLISHYRYDYWDNNNLKQLTIVKYDTEHNIIYTSEVLFDENTGLMTQATRKNPITGRYSIENYIREVNLYSIADYFDKQGIKTNHVIHHNQSLIHAENQILNKAGQVIKTKNREPEDIFDFEKDLPEPYPYNKLMINVKKAHMLFTDSLFEQGLDDNSQYDSEAKQRAEYLGIKPKQVYYHQLPFPGFMAERYKNFPHQAPLTLIQAENQSPNNKYSDLIEIEMGDNYQYKKINKTKWLQTPLTFPLAQFKPLENGVYFYVLGDKNQLTPLESVEQAVSLPTYIRVEKEMGKIISIVKKTRMQWLTTEFAYKKNTPVRSTLTVLESHLVPKLVIDTEYEKGSYFPSSQIIKDAQGNTIRTFKLLKNKTVFAILERFNQQGIKTNHIEISTDGNVKNQYLDNQGNILLTTDEVKDQNAPQLYDDLPFNPDGFDIILQEANTQQS